MKDAKNQPTISKQEFDSVIALYKSGKYHEVIKQIKALNEIYPRVPFLFNLAGVCYQSVGELASSAKMFETAVNIKPDYFEAHKNLGLVFKNLGQVNESVASLNMAISIKSDYFDAHYNLAIILKELGRHDQALNSYEKAISINPNFANAYNNLGNLYLDLGREDDAINSYSRAIQINPNFAQAHNNLGNLFKDIERYEDAIQSYKKAIKANPQLSEAINNLGNLFKTLNQLDNAINCYKKAVAINPHFAEAHYNLGIVFKKTNKKEKALISLERAFSLKPSMDYILGDLLSAKCNFCSWGDYYALIDELQLKISNNKKVVNPFNLLGLIDDPSLQRQAAEIFTNHQYPKKYTLPEIQQYQKHPRIRIGYFSADFHNHATMHLMAELFELHKKSLFEIIAFSFGPDKKDEWRQRAVNSFDKFIDVRHKSDLEVSMIAREMEIDIAVDLKGYTRDCRPKIFVESCAPIQVSFLGYPGTMATDFIDYLIADQTLIPKEKRAHYSEKIAYMPYSYQANVSNRDVSQDPVSRYEHGLPKKGFVFCCFNNNYKITISVFSVWMRILLAVEDSVLWLLENESITKKNLIQEAEKFGINKDRLVFAEMAPVEDHLNRLRLADLFIDTLPYNAHTTASDALRMGVPVLTCIGESFASRVAASLLSALKLHSLITNSHSEYESLAIELATQPKKLKAVKDLLSISLSSETLYNANLFTQNLESAYMQMYDRHNKGLAPEHLYIE